MAKREKNPYKMFTLEELAHAEDKYYYLQVGDEVPIYNGKYTFNKDKAEYFFNELMYNLRHMKENGSPKEKIEAHDCLMNFKIHQLRIH